MQSIIKLSLGVQQLLRCPICKTKLQAFDEGLKCTNIECSTFFPIINDVPVLLDESSSIFSIDNLVHQYEVRTSRVKKTLKSLIPKIDTNIKAKRNYDKFAKLLLDISDNPRVLIVGGKVLGQGMEAMQEYPSIELIESDVLFGPRTMLICDGHSLPFQDESFDGVIAQAVLEHVLDPYQCVEEIHRVLKKQGLVYAETPFMQQVHSGPNDITRFTHLGHRRLFRKFECISSGAVCGPGMALAWSYQYFLLSFTRSKFVRKFIRVFCRLTSFYLKYFDYYLIDKPGTLDAASGYYFLGQKTNRILSDKELIEHYSGAS